MNIGVVGAGVVGTQFLDQIFKRRFKFKSLKVFGGPRTAGTQIQVADHSFKAEALTSGCFKNLDVVFFAVDDSVAAQWAPQAVQQGATVVDNSAHYRMHKEYVLCVPEINAHLLPSPPRPTIIANPNCSTIQLVMLLHPLHQAFVINEVRVCTYQALSGAGRDAYRGLYEQSHHYLKNTYASPQKVAPDRSANPSGLVDRSPQSVNMAFNCWPRIGAVNSQGFCSEEEKIRRETKKILSLPQLKISAFTVRVPVFNAHAEVVWVQFQNSASAAQIQKTLQAMPGVQVCRDTMTQREASGQADVFISHIRQEPDFENTWSFWLVADNLLKGAALNGLQIAEHLK